MDKRVVIVDFNHMAHTLFHSPHRLSVNVVQNGIVITKDTTIQNGAIKNIQKWSNGGSNPTAVCFDRPVIARKAFWQAHVPEMAVGSGNEYKGNRERMPEAMFEGIQDCERILRMAGVPVFAKPNYEADDLVKACVDRARVKYPEMPIDIITNDADMLPLVDEQVSVFLRSRKGTYATDASIEKAHYIQVTPENYQETVQNLSDYKLFEVPYNSILLYKLLRGDKSDAYQMKDISKKFPPKKYNALVEQMLKDGVDFENIFRYAPSTFKIINRKTGLEFPGTMAEALKSPEKNDLYKKLGNSENLNQILNLLRKYTDLDDEELRKIETVYWGMNLNQDYPNPDKRLSRRAFKVGVKGEYDINPWSEVELQKAVEPLKIKLKMY